MPSQVIANMFGREVCEARDSATLHLKIDDDLTCLRILANADLIGIKVFSCEQRLVAGIIRSILAWIKCGTFPQRALTGIPELQDARLYQRLNLLLQVAAVQAW